jgi:4-amino-4-deoxy-L-arabinose transferase-like glycosyltransferase
MTTTALSNPQVARHRRTHLLLKAGGWLLLCWVLVFWRLGYLPLLDPDEAHYAEITREMMSAQEFVVPLLNGQPHIDKPVLFHWLQAGSFRMLGQTEFAARLPSALSAMLLFLVTSWCGSRLFGRDTGERGALLLATIPATFALSYVGVFDMLFTVCLFGALTALCIGAVERRPGLQYLAFVLVAGAVLTKGPVAVVLLSITALLCLLHPETRAATLQLRWGRGIAIVLGVAAPWFLVMWHRFGTQFIDQYVLYNNVSLFGRPLYRANRYPLFYGRVFMTAFLPWSPILLARIVDIVRSRTPIRELPFGEFVLGAWTLTVIGFFSLSWFKLDSYIFPAAPAVCLLAANAWQQARDGGPERSWVRGTLILIPIVLAVGGVGIWIFLFRLNLPIPTYAVILPLSLIVGGVALSIQIVRSGWRPPAFGLALIVPLICAYGTVVAAGFPVIDQTRPTPEIARWLTHVEPGSTELIALYRLSRWKASLRFYAGRPVETVETAEDLRRLLDAHPAAHVVLTERDASHLRQKGIDLTVVYKRSAVLGTEGRGFRRQHWGSVVVATRAPGSHDQ